MTREVVCREGGRTGSMVTGRAGATSTSTARAAGAVVTIALLCGKRRQGTQRSRCVRALGVRICCSGSLTGGRRRAVKTLMMGAGGGRTGMGMAAGVHQHTGAAAGTWTGMTWGATGTVMAAGVRQHTGAAAETWRGMTGERTGFRTRGRDTMAGVPGSSSMLKGSVMSLLPDGRLRPGAALAVGAGTGLQ